MFKRIFGETKGLSLKEIEKFERILEGENVYLDKKEYSKFKGYVLAKEPNDSSLSKREINREVLKFFLGSGGNPKRNIFTDVSELSHENCENYCRYNFPLCNENKILQKEIDSLRSCGPEKEPSAPEEESEKEPLAPKDCSDSEEFYEAEEPPSYSEAIAKH